MLIILKNEWAIFGITLNKNFLQMIFRNHLKKYAYKPILYIYKPSFYYNWSKKLIARKIFLEITVMLRRSSVEWIWRYLSGIDNEPQSCGVVLHLSTVHVFKSDVINATRQIFPDNDIALIGTDSQHPVQGHR